MRMRVARQRLKKIVNEWRAIRRWCISRAANTARDTSSFVAPIYRVCDAVRRFDNSGKRRFRIRMTRKSGPGSFTFVGSVRKYQPRIYADKHRSELRKCDVGLELATCLLVFAQTTCARSSALRLRSPRVAGLFHDGRVKNNRRVRSLGCLVQTAPGSRPLSAFSPRA